jgi:hypothetical protein
MFKDKNTRTDHDLFHSTKISSIAVDVHGKCHVQRVVNPAAKRVPPQPGHTRLANAPGNRNKPPPYCFSRHGIAAKNGKPTGLASTNGIHTSGLTFPQLQAKKDNIEAELRALGSVLESVGRIFAKDKLILIVSSMALI